MNKICDKCFTMFHNETDDNCKMYKCDGNLIDIDDALVSDMILLWNKGYKTISSCSGHPTEDDCKDTVYIEFDGLNSDITRLLKEFNKHDFKVVIDFNKCTVKVSMDFYNYEGWLHSLNELHKACANILPKLKCGINIASDQFKKFYNNCGVVVSSNNIDTISRTPYDELYSYLCNYIDNIKMGYIRKNL